ncbi:endothelin-converting enzyme 1-like isoform X2 [Planococcus citri]|uniref:endothelin-converting enzyme 1-like isoform X2 n=1 Tax=Planococcus citri TaxID=170843 RepID=UPI0031F7CCC2
MENFTKSCNFYLIISVLILVTETILLDTCNTPDECESTAKYLMESVDFEVNPCDDFYSFACGNYPKTHPPEYFSISSPQIRMEENKKLIQGSNSDSAEIIKKIVSELGLSGFMENDDEFMRIPQTVPIYPSPEPDNAEFDCARTLARATRITGIETMPLTVTPSPFNKSINVIRLIRPAYDSMLLNLHKERNLKLTKKAVIEMIMHQSISIEGEERPKLRSLPELHTLQGIQDITTVIAKEENSLFPAFNWTRFIEEMFADLKHLPLKLEDPTDMRVIVDDWDDIKTLIRNIHRVNRTVIEKATVYEITAKFIFFIIAGSQNQLKIEGISLPSIASPKLCTKMTTALFEMPVAYVYKDLEMKTHSKHKEEVRAMVEYTRESLAKIIEQSAWMDKKVEKKAMDKLRAMKTYVGYHNVLDKPQNLEKLYNNVNITNNLMETTLQLEQNNLKIKLNKLNVLNDPSDADWFCPPTIDNAYYMRERNAFIVPSAMLGAPVYTDCSKAFNFGTIGLIIAHEMSHGFDLNGRLYNEKGNSENWWDEETTRKYLKKVKCFVDAYDKYDVTINGKTMKSNSSHTINEDIADNGGFKAILYAYRSYSSETGKGLLVPKFENHTHEQLLTLGFANFFCQSYSSFGALFYKINGIRRDVHSPNKIRVNGVLMHSEEFPKIWNCPKGSNMNPFGEKCSLW